MNLIWDYTGKILLLGVLALVLGCGAPGEGSREFSEGDQAVSIHAKSIKETDLTVIGGAHFGIPWINYERGLVITLHSGERQAVIHHEGYAFSAPDQDEIDELLENQHIAFGPDPRVIAVANEKKDDHWKFVFFLPEGDGFVGYDDQFKSPKSGLLGRKGDEINWDEVPDPEKMMLRFMEDSDVHCEKTAVWYALGDNLKNPVFQEGLVKAWPGCFHIEAWAKQLVKTPNAKGEVPGWSNNDSVVVAPGIREALLTKADELFWKNFPVDEKIGVAEKALELLVATEDSGFFDKYDKILVRQWREPGAIYLLSRRQSNSYEIQSLTASSRRDFLDAYSSFLDEPISDSLSFRHGLQVVKGFSAEELEKKAIERVLADYPEDVRFVDVLTGGWYELDEADQKIMLDKALNIVHSSDSSLHRDAVYLLCAAGRDNESVKALKEGNGTWRIDCGWHAWRRVEQDSTVVKSNQP